MSAKQPQPPRYQIANLQDFLKIPQDRLDACLEDFKDYLEMIRPLAATFKITKLMAQAKGESLNTETVRYGPMIWIDDGESYAQKARVEILDSDEGGMEVKLRMRSD
jgi:hypothetical protein